MSELVERLRAHFADTPEHPGERSFTRPLLSEAADRIAELEARVKDLELCLCNVKYEADRQNGNLVHLKKTIAVQVVAALNPSARSK